MARLCLALTGSTIDENIRVYRQHRQACDMVELRCDYLDGGEYGGIPSFPAAVDVPVILTLRRRRDGGLYTGGEAERVRLLEGGLSGGFSYVDLESDLRGRGLEEKARAAGIRVIRSLHDFKGIPKDLPDIMRSWADAGELPKAAVTPSGTGGLESLLAMYGRLSGLSEYILLGMGEYGFSTRVLAGKLGSALTFCSASGREAAPGLADIAVMDGLFHVRDVGPDTRVYGIIGRPAMHSRSPGIHNPAFRHYGINAAYVPFETDDLEAFFRLAPRIGVNGFSVTMPYKADVLPLLKDVSEDVSAIGSCNTVVWENGGWAGYNTDAGGLLASLRPFFPGGLSGVRAAVLGAGGAAGAAVYALVTRGAEVTLFNRTVEKAEGYARKYGCSFGPLKDFTSSRCIDLIVQATNVGMHPREHEDPAPGYAFSGKEVVCDMIYTPEETLFLKRAGHAGCRTLNGLPMLRAQGQLQFRHFTGLDYPPGVSQG